jgi:hypothetical protein
VPVDFGKAIMRAMAKDRGDRPSTAGELEKELEASIGGAVATPGQSAAAVERQPQDRAATFADRPTPTVGDAGATLVDRGAPSPASESATMPTLVVNADELAARKAAQHAATPQPGPHAHVDVPVAKRRSPFLLIGALAILLVILIGAGGYAFMKFKGTKTAATTPSGGADLAVPMHEVARYWIEVDTKNRDAAMRAGEMVALRSGESFKFHFSPNESGYLYIVGPGPHNAPTTFLTYYANKPKFAAAVNSVASGRDFVYPADSADRSNWITLDSNAGTDDFTFVFSPAPLISPAFFAAPPHQLSPAEINEWENFQAQARSAPSTIEVVNGGASPQAAVKMPQNEAEKASVVFRVRIEHK